MIMMMMFEYNLREFGNALVVHDNLCDCKKNDGPIYLSFLVEAKIACHQLFSIRNISRTEFWMNKSNYYYGLFQVNFGCFKIKDFTSYNQLSSQGVIT